MGAMRDRSRPVVDDPGHSDGGGAVGGHDAVGAETPEEAEGDEDTVVARFQKSATEEVWVTLGRYKGHEVFGVRVWVGLTNGTMRPTRKGVTLRLDTFPQFRAVVDQLEAAINTRQSAAGEPAEGGE